MPVCLVKGDNGSVALVGAEDEVKLVDTLDQLGDPGAAGWQVWDGPVWLEFPRLVEGLPPAGEIDPFELGIGRAAVAESDVGAEFGDAVLAAVHPNLSALRERALEEERGIGWEEFEAAVRADAGCALAGSVFGAAEGEGD